jgi:UrcA family protein
MKSQILAALAATCLLAPCAALAAPANSSDAAPRVSVRYDDLNLNTADGQATLASRVRYAAQKLCGPSDELDRLANSLRVSACMRKTTADIMAQIPVPATVAGSSHAG